MGNQDFHREKILELLEVYKNCPSDFVRGVCLFYIGIHAIDFCLAGMGIQPSTHRGRRKAITNNMDEVVSSTFGKLLSDSLQIRYTALANPEVVERMKAYLKELMSRLGEVYEFPGELSSEINELIG